MNRALLFSALFLIVFQPLVADPEIPASAWEQHPGGIAVAMTLAIGTRTGDREYSVHVYIRNTSSTERYFVDGHIDGGLEIYYINEQGAKVPLHNYHPKDEDFELIERNPKLRNAIIQPGKTLDRGLAISADEYGLLKSHRVICGFSIHDPSSIQDILIQSSPKLLAVEP